MDQQQPDDRAHDAALVPNGNLPQTTAPAYGAAPQAAAPPPHPQTQDQQQPPWQQQPHPQWQQQPPPPPYGYHPPPPIYVTQQVQMAPAAVMGQQKSMGIALLLTFLFGPLGLFYASITGGVVMLILTLVIAIPTLGVGLLFTVPACMVWAALATNNYNAQLTAGTQNYTQNAR